MRPLLASGLIGFALGTGFALTFLVKRELPPPHTVEVSAGPVRASALPDRLPPVDSDVDSRVAAEVAKLSVTKPAVAPPANRKVPHHEALSKVVAFLAAEERGDIGTIWPYVLVLKSGADLVPASLVRAMLADEHPRFRAAGIQLAQKSDPFVIDPLLQIARSDTSEGGSRALAFDMLGVLAPRSPEARAEVIAAARAADDRRRASGVHATRHFAANDREAQQIVLAALRDPNATVRRTAVQQIGHLGPAAFDFARESILSGDYDEYLLNDLASAVVRAGRAPEILLSKEVRPDAVTLIIEALAKVVEEQPEQARALAGKFEILYTKFRPVDTDALFSFFYLALSAGEFDFVLKAVRDPALSNEARMRALDVLTESEQESVRGRTLDAVEEILAGVESTTAFRALVIGEITGFNRFGDADDPHGARFRAILQTVADSDPSFWVREIARQQLE